MERKKIVNISLSFSAVTNIDSWRVKSALSNIVSLVLYRSLFKTHVVQKNCRKKRYDSWKCCAYLCTYTDVKVTGAVLYIPDEPFPNVRATKSVGRQVLCSSETSCDGFQSSKIVKRSVGYLFSRSYEDEMHFKPFWNASVCAALGKMQLPNLHSLTHKS